MPGAPMVPGALLFTRGPVPRNPIRMKSLKIGDLLARFPVIQGGMGVGVSLSGLAAAVAGQGGIGVISCAGLGLIHKDLSPNYLEAAILGLKEELRKAREKAKGIIGVNVMVAMTNFGDMVRTAVAEKADIIFSGAGLPLDLPSYLPEGSATKLAPIVSSARAAKVICEKWKNNYDRLPDAIVVEGPKAGGHLGYKLDEIQDPGFALENILPKVIEQVRIFEEKYGVAIPVIAAGGIYTGEDIYRIMRLGAAGVQMGSRFVTTVECDASDAFKQAYLDAAQADVEIIKSPVGMPGRAIVSPFMVKVRDGQKQPASCPFHCIKTCDISRSPYCIMIALYNAYRGNMQGGFAFAGANAYKARRIDTVAEAFAELSQGYAQAERDAGIGC